MVTRESTSKDAHMAQMAVRLHQKLSPVEQRKRIDRMKLIKDAVTDIEASLLDYDETFPQPFVAYHLATTINNLTMLDTVIVSSCSTIAYNEDMSEWWMIYDDRETDEWVRIDIDGNTGNIHLSTSNKEGPSTGWENVSISEVITMIRSMVENNGYPDADCI